jgi:hypothetical protein
MLGMSCASKESRTYTAKIGVERQVNWLLNFGNCRLELVGGNPSDLLKINFDACTVTFYGLHISENHWIVAPYGELNIMHLSATAEEIRYILDTYQHLTTST